VGKAATVSKGSSTIKASYLCTFNRSIILEAAIAPLKLSSWETVANSNISATAGSSSSKLSLGTETRCTSIVATSRQRTEKEISFEKQILQLLLSASPPAGSSGHQMVGVLCNRKFSCRISSWDLPKANDICRNVNKRPTRIKRVYWY
jgi:hypothetical protein